MITQLKSQEIETVLVSKKMYKISILLILLFSFILIISYMVGGGKHGSLHKIDSHLYFPLSLFSKKKFIIENYEMLRGVSVGTFLLSLFGLFFGYGKLSDSKDRGFFKMNLSRVNVNGVIYHWQDVNSLKFTINSPKIFGERSAKHGFNNWIEFMSESQKHRYEFYLKNQYMEDRLFELISEIETMDGRPPVVAGRLTRDLQIEK